MTKMLPYKFNFSVNSMDLHIEAAPIQSYAKMENIEHIYQLGEYLNSDRFTIFPYVSSVRNDLKVIVKIEPKIQLNNDIKWLISECIEEFAKQTIKVEECFNKAKTSPNDVLDYFRYHTKDADIIKELFEHEIQSYINNISHIAKNWTYYNEFMKI